MRALALASALLGLTTAQAFLLPSPGPAHSQRAAPVRMGFFDALKKGFENEPQNTPAPNAGLKNAPPMVTITFQPANKVVQAVVGQNLKDVAAAARIPIKYNCKKGECGTCTVELNGKKIRTCTAIVPRGMRKNECTIKVLK